MPDWQFLCLRFWPRCIVQRGEDPDAMPPLEGRYANYFKVGYNSFEVVLEFGQLYEGEEVARMHTRVVTGSVYAKRLLETLRQALQTKEESDKSK